MFYLLDFIVRTAVFLLFVCHMFLDFQSYPNSGVIYMILVWEGRLLHSVIFLPPIACKSIWFIVRFSGFWDLPDRIRRWFSLFSRETRWKRKYTKSKYFAFQFDAENFLTL